VSVLVFRSKWLTFTPTVDTPSVSSVSAHPARLRATDPFVLSSSTNQNNHYLKSYGGTDTQRYPTAKTDKSLEAGQGISTPAECAWCGGVLVPHLLDLAGRPALLCPTCRREHYVTDDPEPLCRKGLELRRRYREARRAALGAIPENP